MTTKTCRFISNTAPAFGERVTGVSEGPGYRTEWEGVYEGVKPSEHDGEPVHFFRDGHIGGTPQGCFALPVTNFPDDTPQPAAVLTPRDEYVALVRAIGMGFHPDTRGDDYTSLPDGVTAEDVDRIVEAAFNADFDPYNVALDLIHDIENEEN